MPTPHPHESPNISAETYVNIKLRQIWVMISCTVLCCCTLLGVYYNFKESFNLQAQKTDTEIRILNMRIDRLEQTNNHVESR